MCNQNSLQQKIAELTNDGEDILRFLAETVRGETPGVKPHHRLEASRQLNHLGILGNHAATAGCHSAEHVPAEAVSRNPVTFIRHSRAGGNPEGQDEGGINTPSPLMGEGWDGGDAPANPEPAKPRAREVTYLDILNFNLAQLIRSETAEGHTITEFLLETVTGRDEPFTPNKYKIKPDDRMTAAREVINRGFGRFGRRTKLIDDAEEANDYDTLHSDLAKRMRQYSEHGSQAIRSLLDVMENDFPDEEYTRRHRVSAAQELMRRGWDTNYDRIKMEHLMDYWRDQEDARLSVGQKKQLAGLHTYVDEYDRYDDKSIKDYESIAKQLHEQQDRESEPPRRYRASRKPEEQSLPLAKAGGKDSINTPSPSMGEGWDGGERGKTSSPSCTSMSTSDPEQDCYYEPLSPEDQAIFDYRMKIETGSYEEGEIEIRPVTEASRQDYAATLKWMQQVAAEEGVPLLPNPLSGTLNHPTARSP